jgi:colanic acid/amylovoran biosynthesis glycosyltransferase
MRLVVSQSVEAWLPLTNNWIYNHLSHLDQVDSVILARQLMDHELFPWHPVYAPGKVDLFRFKVAQKLDFRWHPSPYHEAIQRHQPEILHSHFGNVGWYDLPLASKHCLKHIVTFYGADMSLLPTRKPVWLERYQVLFSRSDLFLCEGPHMARQLVALGCPEEKVQVQRLGVPVDEVNYTPRQITEGDPLRVLVAGTFREKKGIPDALEAIGRLHNDGFNVQVTVIGDSRGFTSDEIEKGKILNVIEKYDMRSITRMLGYQSHANMMAEAYRHHVFLSPSVTASDGDTEGGAPVVIIEMAATGMPVVSTRHCDIPQVILDGRTGWLADERDVAGLVCHLQWLIEHPQQWKKRTDLGRKHIEANFDVRKQAKLLGDIYQNLA